MTTICGCHMSKDKSNVSNSIIRLAQMKGNAMQFFLSSPLNWSVSETTNKTDIETFLSFKKEYKIYTVVHGKYLYNFCRPEKGNEYQQKTLAKEIIEANKFDSDVIIHQGKNVASLKQSNDQAIKNFVQGVSHVLDKTSECTTSLILENSCHQGTEIGYTLKELSEIWHSFDSKYHSRLGICIDLCHIFVSGELDIRDITLVNKFFDNFDKLIGISNLKVIHFNDSKVKFNSHNDHHDNILNGYIGNPEKDGSCEGFIRIVQLAKKHSIPLILETPSIGHRNEIKLLKAWSTFSEKK